MNCSMCHHTIRPDEDRAVILGSIGYHRPCWRTLLRGKRAA